VKLSIHAPHAKERVLRQRVTNRRQPGSDPEECREERALPPQSNSVKTFVMARAVPVPGSSKRLKNLSIRMVAGYGESAEIEEVLGCGGLQSSISNIITFEIDLIWPQLAALKRMLRLGERAGKVLRRPFIDML
jgi:hypothetical protein